jgi:hypothetical protein
MMSSSLQQKTFYDEEKGKVPSLRKKKRIKMFPKIPNLTDERKKRLKNREDKLQGGLGRGKELFESSTPTEKAVRDDGQNIQEQVRQETEKKIEEAKEKIAILAEKRTRIIYKCKSVFPFDLFPTEISIEDHRLNIISKRFFATGELRTVSIQDIFEVAVSTDLFFAALRIGARVFTDGTIQVNFLRKSEAIRFQQILEGLRVLTQEGVDTTIMETTELIGKIEDIGRIKERQMI